MSGYGRNEMDLLTPKTVGLVGSLLCVLSMFIPAWKLSLDSFHGEYETEIYWKDNKWNWIAVGLIILFYFLSVWSENKVFMILVFCGLVRQVIAFFKNYKEAQEELDSMGALLEDVSIKPSFALYLAVFAYALLVFGMIKAMREY